VTISPEGKITDVNEATEWMGGVSPEEAIGRQFVDSVAEPEMALVALREVLLRAL
jgi:PAS domain S-box-containing protein